MDPTMFDPANPDHLKSLNSALEGLSTDNGRNCDRLDKLERRKPKTTLVAWILMGALFALSIAGLTVAVVKGKPELVITDEALQGIAVNVNTTIPNGAVQVTPNVTATLSAPADGFKVNPEGLNEIATVIRAQTSSNEVLANAMIEKMGTTPTPTPAPQAQPVQTIQTDLSADDILGGRGTGFKNDSTQKAKVYSLKAARDSKYGNILIPNVDEGRGIAVRMGTTMPTFEFIGCTLPTGYRPILHEGRKDSSGRNWVVFVN